MNDDANELANQLLVYNDSLALSDALDDWADVRDRLSPAERYLLKESSINLKNVFEIACKLHLSLVAAQRRHADYIAIRKELRSDRAALKERIAAILSTGPLARAKAVSTHDVARIAEFETGPGSDAFSRLVLEVFKESGWEYYFVEGHYPHFARPRKAGNGGGKA